MGMTSFTDRELAEILREKVGASEFACAAANLAADRIEELIKKNNNLIELAMDEHKRAETTEYRLTKQIETLERELESVYYDLEYESTTEGET
jgi:predicted nucleotide-binding protein (sugar kinase/HSP70/actin superfamily)